VSQGEDGTVASRLSSEAVSLARGDGLAFGMTPVAIAPKAQISSGERKPMHSATKRTLVTAGGLAAAQESSGRCRTTEPFRRKAFRSSTATLRWLTQATSWARRPPSTQHFSMSCWGPTESKTSCTPQRKRRSAPPTPGLLGDLTGGTAGDGLSFLTGDLGTLLTDLGSALF
jgi:hypothetical protein